ncbi:MAG: hypothetical protein R3253_14790 [Longimicrobiales bacterium]|nr:hypothetical protein [Longimicrobiales bacterium]
MSVRIVTTRFVRPRVGTSSFRRHMVTAMALVVTAACGESTAEVLGPPVPGSLAVSVVTTGFMKDDGYELLVNGESQGVIAANAEATIDELEPATYQVELSDVAENCTVEATSVEVSSNETAAAALAVVCQAPPAEPYAVRASRDRPDLDTGVLVECSFGLCPSDDAWDVWIQFNSQGDPQAVVRHNGGNGVEIAHLDGVALADLTDADVDGATFSVDPIDAPFGPNTVVLVRTDEGNVYALGNPTENTLLLTATFDAMLIASGP